MAADLRPPTRIGRMRLLCRSKAKRVTHNHIMNKQPYDKS